MAAQQAHHDVIKDVGELAEILGGMSVCEPCNYTMLAN